MQQESPGIADNSSMLCKAQGGMGYEAAAVLWYEGEYSGAQGGLGRGKALVQSHPTAVINTSALGGSMGRCRTSEALSPPTPIL